MSYDSNQIVSPSAISPGLVPCDILFFPNRMNIFMGICFTQIKKEKDCHDLVEEQNAVFFGEGFKKLVCHWQKCIMNIADYVEKYWLNKFISRIIFVY